MEVITHRHQPDAVAVQSAERVPSRLRSVAFWKPLLLHILHNENTLFLGCRSSSTVNTLTPTAPSWTVCGWCARVWFIWTTCASSTSQPYVT